ncbi:MAG: M23 family metallopeptidase [Bacteroidetes bacterium]|nr:M23 family metallopeptidase [Bacteroidota bacterium]
MNLLYKLSIRFLLILITCDSYAQVIAPVDSGGGGVPAGPMDELTPAQQNAIQKAIDKNIDSLGLTPSGQQLLPPALIWPLQPAPGNTDPGYCGISNYIDRNPAFPNQLQDYNCGTRTYDLSSGYNHSGTDIYLWPFPWYQMDNNLVQVIAAAPGTIVYKSDGNFDRNCGFNNNNWNAVYVQHSDGSVAWYGHLKTGSLTTKAIGQTVVAGEYLGVVGSSGSSTGPHLHFELRSNTNTTLDPWNGPCNTNASLWANQEPYYVSKLNKLMVGKSAASYPACPTQELPNIASQFCQGNTIYCTASYRDQQNGQQVLHKLIQPNNVVWQQWTQTFTTYYSGSWWWYSWVLPSSPLTGTWKYQIIYQGVTSETTFNVSTNVTAGISITRTPSGAVCAGSSATFNSSVTNPGLAPAYQWKKNGANVGTNSSTYTTTSLLNNDVVNCTLTSNANCVTNSPVVSNSLTVTVSPNVTPAVSITKSPAGNRCKGSAITFTPTPTNGGATPAYQWKVNNINTGTGNSLVTSTLNHGDSVKVIMTSNASCVTSATATSNTITAPVYACSISLLLKTIIEGLYDGGTDSMIAAIDPINFPQVSDSLTIFLADSASLNLVSSSTKALSRTGEALFTFSGLIPGNRYYIVARHRSTIETWSKHSMLFPNEFPQFDFSTP